MSVSAVSNNYDSYQVNLQTNFAKRKQYFNELGQALQSGDLVSAQKDFAALQQLTPDSGRDSTTQLSSSAANPFSSDISALNQAFQSGDLTAAQKAFAQFQQDIQSAQANHHHHHYSQVANLTGTTQDSGGSTPGNSINIIA